MKTRKEKLLDGLDPSKLIGAEIGPLHNPLVPRAEGHIIYVDHKSAEELRETYANDSFVKLENIQVDAIWCKHTLQEAVGLYFQARGQTPQSLDYVVASHVIEHVPDLVTWLHEIRSVLTSTGEVRLAVPDKRYTFDYLRRTTQIEDVLVAYLNRARIPNTHCLLDFCLNEVAVNTVAAWQGTLDVTQLKKGHTTAGAMHVARDAMQNGTYHDVHCWVFTPASFAQLFVALAEADLVDFACSAYFEPVQFTNEFIVNLRVNADKAAVLASWRQMAETVRMAEQQAADLAEQNRRQELLALERIKWEAQADVAAQAEAAARHAMEAARHAVRPRVTGIRSALKAIAYAIKS